MKKFALAGLVLLLGALAVPAQTVGLKITGGAGYAVGGDLATGLQGQSDYLRTQFGATSSYAFPKTGWTGTGEILLYLGSGAALGFGAGYEKHVQESTVAYTVSGIDVRETVKPDVTVMPLLGSLHLFFPLGSAVRLDFFLGGGAYRTTLNWNSSYDLSFLGLSGSDASTYQATRTGYGAHAGLGLEINLSSRMALVLNVTGRYARVSGFQGDWTETGTGDFWSFSDGGTGQRVYSYDWTFAGTTYPQIEFRSDAPSGAGVANVREARLDLKGLTATVGFRINLF